MSGQSTIAMLIRAYNAAGYWPHLLDSHVPEDDRWMTISEHRPAQQSA